VSVVEAHERAVGRKEKLKIKYMQMQTLPYTHLGDLHMQKIYSFFMWYAIVLIIIEELLVAF
jgi:hypothetical protein